MTDHRDITVVASLKQSPGTVPTPSSVTPPSKRNSGLFAFFKWFRSTSKESVDSARDSPTSSLGSTSSLNSTGTAASFNFISPTAYIPPIVSNKCINPGPETDTYKARLKQRDRIREKDKNLTLRKKYNLFFSRDKDTAKRKETSEESCKSLPLMTKTKMEDEDNKGHRRTNSDSSKGRKAGAYLHVKGKRKAPAPPHNLKEDLSLRRKKRLAPAPPGQQPMADKVSGGDLVYADVDVIQNDCLKLDHGVLKPMKVQLPKPEKSPLLGVPNSKSDIPVSPKPWYKRQTKKEKDKDRDSKYEPVIPPTNNDNNNFKGFIKGLEESKRRSNMVFLTNISELDREATEIIRQQQHNTTTSNMPEFMKPKCIIPPEEVTLTPAKRKSAKDLIAKFNAITNVTKVTVNSAIFGERKDYFGKKKDLKNFDNQGHGHTQSETVNGFGLTKCETSDCIVPNLDKPERKNWACPKCNLDNDYWRIICQVCSTIKPYFDNFGSSDSPPKLSKDDLKTPPKVINSSSSSSHSSNNSLNTKESKTIELPVLARSKTQIHFTNNRLQKSSNFGQGEDTKREEKEKLKKMLIEMKNSLPKRKSHMVLQNRKSTIDEGLEVLETPQEVQQNLDNTTKAEGQSEAKPQSQSESTPNVNLNTPKDDKLQSIDEKIIAKEKEITKQSVVTEEPYQLLRPKDFEDIYSEKVAVNPGHVYANLPGSSTSCSSSSSSEVFISVPQKLNELKQNLLGASGSAGDTLEINKLLRRLENAIAKGDLGDAAGYARELAQLKVNCSVIRQKPNYGPHDLDPTNKFIVNMYVEDRLSHRGPFPIEVCDEQTVHELKQQVQKEFEIPIEVQRWILGKELASNDKVKLKDHNVTKGCPLFLYLVAPSAVKGKSSKVEMKELNVEKDKSKGSISGIPVPNASKMSPKVLIRSEKSAFAVVPSNNVGVSSGALGNPPKIVGEHLKVHVMIKPKSNAETQIGEIAKTSSSVSTSTTQSQLAVKAKTPPKAEQEDFSEYDKTLRPPKGQNEAHWICHMCTLVNSPTANICSVCTTVRLKLTQPQTSAPAVVNKLHYYELMHLDNSDLVPNSDTFECLICLTEVPPKVGVTLRDCLHQFCKACLAHTIEFCDEAEVKCPYRDPQYSCDIPLQGREIKALVSKQVHDQFLAKSVAQAENRMAKTFHCKTPDCTGWCVFEDNVNEFRCPICQKTNCLTCQAIHLGVNCRQYQERMQQHSETDDDARQTTKMLDDMVEKGEALTCPACQVVLMKKWGCDWVRCSMCKTEICWVTRGLRWGPGGKGDTSGGCKCGVNGVKCHAKCNYCH